jgi:hypothetical protein
MKVSFYNVIVLHLLLLVTTSVLEGGGVVVVQAQEATIADKWRIDTNVDIDYWNYVFDFTYT